MKIIGLLGGTHWISTIEYYKRINQMVHARIGKYHSARIFLNSIDYQQIKQYDYKNWEKIADILQDEILKLACCEIDCLLICSNVLHKAYQEIEASLEIDVPVFHIIDCAGEAAQKENAQNILLLGTQFVMEDGFYQERLAQKFQLTVKTPNETERKEVQRIIQAELAHGEIRPESQKWMTSIIEKHQDIDAVLLGCTELPLLFKENIPLAVPVLDTLQIHCERAVHFALS